MKKYLNHFQRFRTVNHLAMEVLFHDSHTLTDRTAVMPNFSMFFVAVALLMHFANAGFRPESFDKLIFLLDLRFPGWDLNGISILEFGDQVFFGDYPDYYAPFSRSNISIDIARNHLPAKVYFQQIPGVNHTSIDINGKNGAIALDVRKPMTALLSENYNVITNYGFTEHVGEGELERDLVLNQYLVFKDFWYAHGVCGYENEFFEGLIAANGYKLLLAPTLYKTNTFVAFVKQADTQFITLEQFSQTSGLKSKYTHYLKKKLRVVRKSGQLLEQIVDFSVTDRSLFAVELCVAEFNSASPQDLLDCVETAINALSYVGVYTMTIQAPDDPRASVITVDPVHN